MPVALSLQAVRVRYGDRVAVDGVTLAAHRGEVVGLLGPNGSGKSTTLAAAAGVIDPVEGTVAVEGVERAADPAGYARRFGLVPQRPALYDELTAADNLRFFGRLYGFGGRELARRVARGLARVGLTDRAAHRVGTFSGGMRQRVNLAAALLHDPPVVLLDEPAAALDPECRDALLADLARLRDDGHAVLLSTHHPDEAGHACDRVVVLDRGRVAATGRPGEVFACRPGGRAVLYGHLRSRPPKFLVRSLRQRLGPAVELGITGNRLRLAADDREALGRGLAAVLAEGVEVESFRTPAGTLERVLRQTRVDVPFGIGT
ncbi:MAG: ABC transporter ATP-binding protein [Gemmataceae bacterium]|nr:ABC transporter ATP-binding protein [Gemmataceae bacterium]